MARKVTPGLLGAGNPAGVFAAHNQGVVRGQYQGQGRAGFFVEFLSTKELRQFEDALADGALAVERTSIEAAVATGDELKQKLRGYLDGVFQGSAATANSHRRASNAMVQSATFQTVRGAPGFTYLLYSKLGRGKGPASFVDFLLTHLHGGSFKARTWFRLAVSAESRALRAGGGFVPTGSFPGAGTKVFFKRAKDDPDKLFLLRQDTRTGKTQLLDVLLKSVRIAPKLAGLKPLLDQGEAIFERHADQAWARRQAAGGGA